MGLSVGCEGYNFCCNHYVCMHSMASALSVVEAVK